MKNKKLKVLFLFLFLFLMTGCTQILKDENNKIVKYDADIICNDCSSKCDSIKEEYNALTAKKNKTKEEVSRLEVLTTETSTCTAECENKCSLAKKNETGQNLTSNILCKPTNSDVIEIYKKYNVDVNSLPSCSEFNAFSNYEGLWISIFVKPLTWLIIKTGIFFNNYGLALVIISILIRAALMPVTKKTALQSENLKKAQPEIDKVNKKYEGKTDQQSQMQKSQDTLVIYKKYNINPLSSCLFAIIQIPLLFAFIEAINRTPAIFEGRFLGLDLGLTPWTAIKSGAWWYIIIVIILAAVTYFSLNLTKTPGSSGDDTQKQMAIMNKVMLVFITYASFTLSTAICIYWISSSAFTMVQNMLVKRVNKK
jgi:YidC/Oxa1 family membrane protein insertase